MKVLFFCNLIAEKLGAYEWLLVMLGRQFRDAGDTLVLALAREPIPAVGAQLREAGVQLETVSGWTDAGGREHAWAFCRPALRLLRRERPDVAVVNYGNEFPGLVTAAASRLSASRGTRWIWVQHQQVRDPGGLAARLSRLRLLALAFDHFVAVYDGGRDSLRMRGIGASRLSVVYNGIGDHTPTVLREAVRRALGQQPGACMAVCIGWLIPRKRVDWVIRAFASAASGIEHAHLLVIGDGPERVALERQAAASAVAGRVHFLGLRDDVRDVVAASDVLVHASRAETCTYAITEAMAAGIPAVVANAGAAREQIADGESGFVVGRDDEGALAARLATLLRDAELRARMGAAARERFSVRYRVEDSVAQLHDLCRRVAGMRSSAGDTKLP